MEQLMPRRSIIAAIYRSRMTAVMFTVSLWIIIDVVIGSLGVPELLEPVSLLVTTAAGIMTGLFFHSLGRNRR